MKRDYLGWADADEVQEWRTATRKMAVYYRLLHDALVGAGFSEEAAEDIVKVRAFPTPDAAPLYAALGGMLEHLRPEDEA